MNLAEILESANVEEVTLDEGEIPTRAIVIVVRDHPDWVAPKPMIGTTKGMGFEELIGLLVSVTDYYRAENVKAWRGAEDGD